MAELVATRCSAVLGFRPSIQAQPAQVEKQDRALSYSIEKLRNTGFLLTGNFGAEIDDALRFCRNNFARE